MRLIKLLCLIFTVAQAHGVHVVATFSILGDFVRQVGGKYVTVYTIVGANTDAHVYVPTPRDVRQLLSADLVVKNGLGFEGWMDRLIKASGYKGTLCTASHGVCPRLVFQGTMVTDPHAWHAVPNARIYVQNIRNALIQKDPDNAMYYEQNAARYLTLLDHLDSWIRKEVEKMPAMRRFIITDHDAFQYFGLAYSIRFLAPRGLSTESEPSAKDIKHIIEFIKDNKVSTIFVENISNPRQIQAIARDSGATIGDTLYSDALSEDKGPAASYIAMMQHNTRHFIQSMQPVCSAK